MKMLIMLAGAALAATTAVAEPVTKTITFDRPNYDATRVVVRDKDARTLTRDTDVIRERDGATASRDYSRTRTDSGFVAEGSQTGFGGRTYTYDAARVRTASGYNSDRTVTGANSSPLYNRNVAVDRSGGNVTRSVDVTRAKGFHRTQGRGRGLGGGRRR